MINRMKNYKRSITLLLSVVLCGSFVLMPVQADEWNETQMIASKILPPNEEIEPQLSDEEKAAIDQQVEEEVFTVQSTDSGVMQKIERLKSLYPEGSYFTDNGKSCGSAGHKSCDHCKLSNILRARHPEMVGKLNGESWSCCAFARFAFYYIFEHGTDSTELNMTYVGNSFNKARPGDYIIYYSGKNPAHYGIYLSGNQIIDSNATGVGACQVKYGNTSSNTYKTIKVYRSTNYEAINNKDQGLFDDVYMGMWHYDYVKYLKEKGIMTGLNPTTFGSSEPIARAQIAVIIHRLAGTPSVKYEAVFPDVPNAQFYTLAVLWAYQNKVILGYTDTGTFKPNAFTTRQELVVILHRYAKMLGKDNGARANLSNYPDASMVADYATDAMRWAVANGIISGDNGRLNPMMETKRAEAAKMVSVFCRSYIK